jgi:phosphoribosylaminoimidazolecarboxamide formyltransferase/IMP cyclohydrolase
MKKSALLSVYYKDGIEDLARGLTENGWALISTGGTAAFLREKGFSLTDVSERTHFPECLDGRVKTLHPAIHAGILARRADANHISTLKMMNISPIDLVCVNLYPFFEKSCAGLTLDETIEFIDIGGPAMLRAAAKNWRDVIVLCDSVDYQPVCTALATGGADEAMRRTLAGKAFNLTAAYDAAVAQYMLSDAAPRYWTVPLERGGELRYGENAHQKAALYSAAGRRGLPGGREQLGGKDLSYNNIRDLDLAWKCVCAFGLDADGTPALGAEEVHRFLPGIEQANHSCCVAVKHNTPCGIALGSSARTAFEKARACDPVSIFGGIVAFNTPLSGEAARALADVFLEVVAAPEFDEDALKILRTKKNLRIIRAPCAPRDRFETVSVDGGLLVQETNRRLLEKWELVTAAAPGPALLPDLIFGLRAVNFVKSNGIVVAADGAALGISGGETSRISAAELALNRARQGIGRLNEAEPDGERRPIPPLILASDAFLPFPDVVEAAAREGIAAIVQCGGSTSDQESIDACNNHNIPMIFTGLRSFKH